MGGFGGMARSGSEFERPRSDLHVAGIGPVTSFVLVGIDTRSDIARWIERTRLMEGR